jgi:hypothetical protein
MVIANKKQAITFKQLSALIKEKQIRIIKLGMFTAGGNFGVVK